MKKIYSLLLFMLASSALAAQQLNVGTDNIKWISSQTVVSETTYAFTTTIVSSPSDGKILFTKNGRQKPFIIQSTSGAWPDTTQEGKIIFYTKYGDADATVSFERNPDQIIVSITISGQPTLNVIVDQILNP